MSGVSVAAGQTMAPQAQPEGGQAVGPTSASSSSGALSRFSFLQVQLLACILVFTVSGLVPVEEIGTAIFTTIYIAALSIYVFPNKSGKKAPALFGVHTWFPLYAALGTTIGLFLPLAYVFGSFTNGDQEAVAAATPHLFLMACQLLTENVIVMFDWIPLPVRALATLIYTARRLVVINGWIRILFAENPLSIQLPYFQLFGRALALANAGFWSANLALFVIPMLLPRAFEKHYELQYGARQGGPVEEIPSGERGVESEGKKGQKGKAGFFQGFPSFKSKAI